MEAIKIAVAEAVKPFIDSITRLSDDTAVVKLQLDQKDTVITQLEARIAQLETRPDNSILQERVDQLEAAHDGLDQYGRRMNVRIENIPFDEGETPASLQTSVLEKLNAAGAKIAPADVMRLHRSTALRRRPGDSPTAPRSSQVIVRLTNWRARESAHLARNQARVNGHAIKQDLTQSRRELISEAHAAMRDWAQSATPVYCYANINCKVVMRRGREVEQIHSHADLERVLDLFHPR